MRHLRIRTDEQLLRLVYEGLREDKPAREVRRDEIAGESPILLKPR